MHSVKLDAKNTRLVNLLARRVGVTEGTLRSALFKQSVVPFLDSGLSVVEIERSLSPLVPMINSIADNIELSIGEGA